MTAVAASSSRSGNGGEENSKEIDTPLATTLAVFTWLLLSHRCCKKCAAPCTGRNTAVGGGCVWRACCTASPTAAAGRRRRVVPATHGEGGGAGPPSTELRAVRDTYDGCQAARYEERHRVRVVVALERVLKPSQRRRRSGLNTSLISPVQLRRGHEQLSKARSHLCLWEHFCQWTASEWRTSARAVLGRAKRLLSNGVHCEFAGLHHLTAAVAFRVSAMTMVGMQTSHAVGFFGVLCATSSKIHHMLACLMPRLETSNLSYTQAEENVWREGWR